MLEKFQQYIVEQSLATKDQKIMLAVSGGIDSMVMLHLFRQLKEYPIAIAHCNFQLRGDESENDQVFVGNIARQNNIDFFTENFNTGQFASENKISIQMAARELRYNWFMKLAEKHQFHRIAIAHNMDDIVETMIINLVRGTGTKGLTGIKPLSGITIRPLLFASREKIESYAKQNEISYREDSSNAETKYKRNLIRHRILPLLEELNPSMRETLSQETEIFSATWNVYQQKVKLLKKEILTKQDNRYLIQVAKLIELDINPPLLYDILSAFGFSYPTVKNILKNIHGDVGKLFYSAEFVLLRDREYFIIEKSRESSHEEVFLIEENATEISRPIHLSIHKFLWKDDHSIPKTGSIASLDLDKISFPLCIRHWQEGDYFYPLGLGGKKKLSDFFTDSKIDLFEKKRIWLLTSANEIVWIVGYRIDDRFKITPKTRNILMLELKD